MNIPSEAVRQMVAASVGNKASLTATELKGLGVEQAAKMMESVEGEVRIDVTKVPPAERVALSQASALLPEGKVNFFTTPGEDSILQQITADLCDSPAIFVRFLRELWAESPDHFCKEWDSFIVGHEVAGKALSPEGTHHWSNIGLGDASHPLRQSVRQLIAGVPADFLTELSSILPYLKAHPFLTAESDILSALLLAMVSNFVRGGVYYHLTSPAKCEGYFPRKVAVRVINS